MLSVIINKNIGHASAEIKIQSATMFYPVGTGFKYVQVPFISDLSLARNTAIRILNSYNIAFLSFVDILVPSELEMYNCFFVMGMPDRNNLT